MRHFVASLVASIAAACAHYPQADTSDSTVQELNTEKVGLFAGDGSTYRSKVNGRSKLQRDSALLPFTLYLHRIHLNLHPRFADEYLASRNDPLSSAIHANVEVVIDGKTGAFHQAGIVTSSGDPAFDMGALRAMQVTFPIEPVPPDIVSPDGFVYIVWEFYEDPRYACSTYFAHPFILADSR